MKSRFSFLFNWFFVLLCGCMVASCGRDKEEVIPEVISYNFHVRPILSDKCFACHGPDANKREAQLRLDIADSAFAPL